MSKPVHIHANERDTIAALQYYETAIQLRDSSQYDSAVTYFEKAISLYRRAENWHGVVRGLNNLGVNYRAKSNFSMAELYLKQAIEVSRAKIGNENHEIALSYYHLGRVYRRKNEFDNALKYYRDALDVDLKVLEADDSHIALIHLRIGMAHNGLFQYDSAIQYVNKASAIWLRNIDSNQELMASAYTGLAIIYRNKRVYHLALEYAEKSLQIRQQTLDSEHPSIASSHTAIGNIHADLGNYNLALQHFNKALMIELKAYGEIHPYVASDYLRIGIMHIDKHEYDLALEYYQKSLHIKSVLFGPTSKQVAGIYDRIGTLYSTNGSYAKALDYLKKSLEIKLEVLSGQHPSVADSYFRIGANYKKQGAYGAALENLKIGQRIRSQVSGTANFSMASFANEIGSTLQHMSAYNEALNHYQKALALYIESYGKIHVDVAKCYRSIGNLYRDQDMIDVALDYYQNSIVNFVDDFDVKNSTINLKPESTRHEHELMYTLNAKALALEKRFALFSNPKDLELAFSTFMLSIDLIDRIRVGYTSERTKLDFAGEIHATYQGAMRAGWKLFEHIGEDSILHVLYKVAEKSKSGILREAITEMQAKHNAGIPDSLLALENRLRVELTYYDTEIHGLRSRNNGLDSLLLIEYEDKYFDLNRRYEILINALEDDYHQYYQLKYNNEVASVDQIQKSLDNDSTLVLEYFIGDNLIYVFCIGKEYFFVHAFRPSLNLIELTDQLRHSISEFDFIEDSVVEAYNLYTQSAWNLYDQIISDPVSSIQGEVSRLIVIPDGILTELPFEALLYDSMSTVKTLEHIDYQNLPYLIKHFEISYSHSATMLEENMRRPASETKNVCLAFAPTYDEQTSYIAMRGTFPFLRSEDLKDLPGARREVQAISHFVDGHFRFGREANELAFKENAGQYQILHLAMHGQTNDEYPSYSKLIFDDERDSVEDNTLYVYELYNTRINADLVVLSACQTGSGKYMEGEGVMSLARAFMYAGSPSVVQTLWNTDDRASAYLMTGFYENLTNGSYKDAALQNSKRQYIQSSDGLRSHPFFWAGFTI